MTSAVYNGFAQAATLPCSPASDLYDAQLAAQYAYSATAFQAAIHNAGVPTSETDCPVLLVCSDDPARVRAAEYLSSSMQENGFFLKVRSLGREVICSRSSIFRRISSIFQSVPAKYPFGQN